jgi:hypothetical protein
MKVKEVTTLYSIVDQCYETNCSATLSD